MLHYIYIYIGVPPIPLATGPIDKARDSLMRNILTDDNPPEPGRWLAGGAKAATSEALPEPKAYTSK